ncbi:ROK family protein [Maritalea mediterranea]|uniref:ROK family protein n=1 Tax=Maritalea mediterranea TaxID=2909667 RepID=A0ABS9E3C1_9HYPH|nr:ROK family protein [Maritalea mediterranea]MCF4097355.1 ROK family protein [Maritalea mediterranea]
MADSAASPPRLGIDLGGTKIQFVLLRDGELVAERRVNTPKSLTDITQVLVDGAAHFRAYFGQIGFIGMCAPGSAHPDTGLWRNANILTLNGHDLAAHFAQALAQQVVIENDANCFALSCAYDENGAAPEMVYALTVGTGLGGGLVYNGQLIKGAGGLAAEAGHVPLSLLPEATADWPLCYCGQRGCTEQLLSGTGLSQYHARQHAQEQSAIDILGDAARGEPAAQASLEQFKCSFAHYLATIIQLLDPHRLVIGGGMAAQTTLWQEIFVQVEPLCFSKQIKTKFEIAGDSALQAARGAAYLTSNSSHTEQAKIYA